MSDFLVAYFHTEIEANASAEKLLAYGIHHDQLTLYAEKEWNLPPIEPIPSLSSLAQTTLTDIVRPSALEQAPERPEDASPFGNSATLAVVLTDPTSVKDVCSVLNGAGAYLIDVTEKNVTQEYPDM